jgi:hypothetical protein
LEDFCPGDEKNHDSRAQDSYRRDDQSGPPITNFEAILCRRFTVKQDNDEEGDEEVEEESIKDMVRE